MHEDGLPISNIFLPTYTHDLFYRTDATLNRLEAVRGGTASIAGANAPGGIFNYLSKTGTSVFSGLVRQKFGLEGDGRNFYTRNEANFGGPLAKGWTYNVGGFYRHARGARDVGYPLNFGGQIKANIQKKYGKGTVALYAKYLNNHNGTFLNLIGRNFEKPEIASQFSNNDAFILPAAAKLSTKTGDGAAINYDPTDLNHSIDASFGLNWKHDLGKGFSISDNARFSHKELTLNITQATTPALLTAVPINGSVGTIAAGVGTITYKDNATKQVLAIVGRTTPAPVFTVLSNNLPNQDVIANSVLYQAALTGNPKVNEFFDVTNPPITINKNTFDAIVVGSGISGGWAAKELTQKGLKVLMLDRGRDISHVSGYETAMTDPWDLKHRGKISVNVQQEYASLVRAGYAQEANRYLFESDKEHPYIEKKGYHTGGKSLMWGRHSYRWNKDDFEANGREGVGVD